MPALARAERPGADPTHEPPATLRARVLNICTL